MKIKIKEELLHYLWQLKKFEHSDLRTTDGKEVRIISYGRLNYNAGPDFLEGKIEIDGTVWAGHIEMHLFSSDWYKHRHHKDPAYNNVILHVVMEHDQVVTLPSGEVIPCLVLENRISDQLLTQYQHLLNNKNWVPCEDHITEVSEIIKHSTIQRMMAERVIDKCQLLKQQLGNLDNDIAKLVYQRLAYSFGLSVNGHAMETLAIQTPYTIIQKHRDDLFQLEALLFGQSGLLDKSKDEYALSLLKEYKILAHKYTLTPMKAVAWKYSKLRPAAFPTIRIAQFSKLLHTISRIDHLILNGSLKEIHEALDLKADGYWKYHYNFDTPSAPRAKALGKTKRNTIVINTIVPILWLCGEMRQDQTLKDKAIALLELISAEKNSITTRWVQLGMSNLNAADSQGLLHLKKYYCDKQGCLKCPIGTSII